MYNAPQGGDCTTPAFVISVALLHDCCMLQVPEDEREAYEKGQHLRNADAAMAEQVCTELVRGMHGALVRPLVHVLSSVLVRLCLPEASSCLCTHPARQCTAVCCKLVGPTRKCSLQLYYKLPAHDLAICFWLRLLVIWKDCAMHAPPMHVIGSQQPRVIQPGEPPVPARAHWEHSSE